MKIHSRTAVFLPSFWLIVTAAVPAWAQPVFRCHSSNSGVPEYINNLKEAQLRNCKAVEGGNVTVVPGTAVQPRPVVKLPAAVSSGGGNRIEAGPEQRARDSDSRTILESELKKAEARLAEQQKEYNNGEPEKQGIEGRNYQRYLDRIADIKEGMARNQSDIAGLKRELSRLPPAAY